MEDDWKSLSAFVASVESGEEAVNLSQNRDTKPVDIDGSEARDVNDGVVDDVDRCAGGDVNSAGVDSAVQSRLGHRLREVVVESLTAWAVESLTA